MSSDASVANGAVASKKDTARRNAAHLAVQEHIQDCQIVGIGSGRTMVFAVEKIAEIVKKNGWSIKCIPTSHQARQLILQHELYLWQLESCRQPLDWAIDGADELDTELNLIKGGGGCLLQEKVVDAAAGRFVVVCDEAKRSEKFGDRWRGGVPIEVLPMAWSVVQRRVEAEFGGRAVLREANGKVGPVVTDNGNFLLDWHFDRQHNWAHVDNELHQIPGLVETGLFIGLASVVYVGSFGGSVEKLLPHSSQ